MKIDLASELDSRFFAYTIFRNGDAMSVRARAPCLPSASMQRHSRTRVGNAEREEQGVEKGARKTSWRT